MPEYNQKIYTLIAGVNGAGKSTYYSIIENNKIDDLGIHINYDELQKKYQNDMKAGKCSDIDVWDNSVSMELILRINKEVQRVGNIPELAKDMIEDVLRLRG